MNRDDIFNRAFDGHPFLNFFYKKPDDQLREMWTKIPQEKRDELFPLPPTEPDDLEKYSGRVREYKLQEYADVRKVADYYRFRASEDFMPELPSFFRRMLILADDDDMLDTLFLGTLGALSICMPKVRGSLFKEEIRPNLYIFLTGPAASGKGKIGLCRRLLGIVNILSEECRLIIPANSSDTALYEALASNGGRGIIFESEADTLSQAFRKGSGKFSDGLRCAFHNEAITYLRRTGHEKIYINHPELSMVLTGTPGQVPRLLQSPENGLFSRILFYRLVSEKESYAEDLSAANDLTGKMVNEYLEILAVEIAMFYNKLRNSKGIEFRLSEDQHAQFMSHFHDITCTYKDMVWQAYGTDDAVEHIDSIMKRLGNICYRIMMILTVSRLIDKGDEEPLPEELVCDQRDFDRIIFLSEFFFHHTLIHYDELMVAAGQVPEVEDDEPTDTDMLSDAQREYFNALPMTFIKQKALQIGVEMSVNSRKVERYLKYFCELGIVTREKRGVYEKSNGSYDIERGQ